MHLKQQQQVYDSGDKIKDLAGLFGQEMAMCRPRRLHLCPRGPRGLFSLSSISLAPLDDCSFRADPVLVGQRKPAAKGCVNVTGFTS